jgi:methanogenic corrinoid protein MtbC1
MSGDSIRELTAALRVYDKEGCEIWAKKVLEEGVNPLEALDALTEVVQEVGDGYTRGSLFLPELVGAGVAMESATAILDREIIRRGIKKKSAGTVVIGTVYGDIHSIGKNMVSTLLTAGGFTVYDLGINVKAEEFVQAVKNRGPDILAMSALLTTTAHEQRIVVETLGKEGLRDRVKLIVGGGAITDNFARKIGADGYAPTAPLAVDLAKSILKGEETG